METIERTDCHRPAALVPGDYEYVAQEHMKDAEWEWAAENRRRIQEHMKATGGTYSRHEHGGNCMVCGSVNAIYTVLFYHAKTNSYVRMGQECAALVDARAAAGLDDLRDQVRNWGEAQKGIKKASAVLADIGLTDAFVVWDEYRKAWKAYRQEEGAVSKPITTDEQRKTLEANGVDTSETPYSKLHRDDRIIVDMVEKLVRYGSISEKQENFLRKLVEGRVGRDEREAAAAAAKQAEHDAAADAPEGKAEVSGEILSLRLQESCYGTVLKMLVKLTTGAKVWGSCPTGTGAAQRGDRITFKATFEKSKDDAKFGFYKRPRLVNFEEVGERDPAKGPKQEKDYRDRW